MKWIDKDAASNRVLSQYYKYIYPMADITVNIETEN